MDKKNKNNIAKILLAFGVLASPMMLANQVSADNSIANTTNTSNVDATATAQSDAVTTENVIKENKEDKEQAKKEQAKEVVTTAAKNTKAKATKEATTKENTATDETEATSQKEEASEEKKEAVVEGKEAFTLTEAQKQALKQAGFTDAEIAGIEKEIANQKLADANFDAEDFLNKKLAEKKPAAENTPAAEETNALEMAEEIKSEAVAAADEARAPKDISNEVTDVNISIKGLDNEDATMIKPIAEDPDIKGKTFNDQLYDTQAMAHVDFRVPDTAVAGDTIDIKLSPNVNPNGIISDFNPEALDAKIGSEVVGKASYDKENSLMRYTLTDLVKNYGNVKIVSEFPLFIDKEKVTEPVSDQKVSVSVGNKTQEKTYTVDYNMSDVGQKNKKFVSNGYSDITHVSLDDETYDHIIYMNPFSKEQKGTLVQIKNLPGENGVVNDGVVFDQDVLDSVEVYVVNDLSKLPMSFAWNKETKENLTKLPEIEPGTNKTVYTKKIVDGTIIVDINNNQDVMLSKAKRGPVDKNATIVIKYKGKFKSDATKDAATRVIFDNTPYDGAGKRVTSKEDYFFWDNIIYTTSSKAYGEGNKEFGRFEDIHIYQTINSDGTITTDDYVYGSKQQDVPSKYYTTKQIPREGYTLVKVTSPDGASFSTEGKETSANFVAGKTLHVKYVYQKRPVEKKGSFQEHHIYQTKKLDGTIVEDSRDDKEVKEGTEKENYKTSKIDKEGYKLIKVTSENGGQFNEDGSEKEAPYIADTKQEVTYIYQKEEQKPVEKKGSFQEHHIYQTKKLDGTIVEDSRDDKEVKEGTEKENYKTSKIDKEGYKLIKVTSENGGQFNEDGSEKEAPYIADTKQEVTYIYQKEEQKPVEKKGSFQEHHIYQTKKLDGTIVEDSRDDKEVKEGTEKENYKTSKIDKEGYKLIKVTSENGGQFNEDGSEKEAPYIADTKQEVTYIYQKEEQKPVEKKGSFQEHHIYQTKKLDGTIVEDSRDDKEVKEGTEKENYKTSKIDKEGYKLIKVTSENGGQFNEDGSEKEAPYIADTKQEVTYIYQKEEQKPVEKKGSFQEHHIYQTKKLDGTIVEDSRDDKEVKEGTEKENYKTSKIDKEGYKLIKVTSENGGQFNEDGSEKEAPYIADTKQEVTYIYQKEEQKPVEKKGSFQEHHIYQTKKLDGTIVKDDEVNKDVTEGTEKENYKTSKEDRDGYKLIEVKSVNGGQFNKDGSEKEAAYIADTKQEVTYIYQKEEAKPWTPVEETGKFQEHHIYITKDKDGKEIKRELVDGKVTGGTKDMTYKTRKAEKDGFKFVRTEDAKENPSYDKDGKETTGNYKPGVKQEITYVYEKTQNDWTPIEETGKFQEHHIYITKDKDGKEIKRELVDGKVTGGTKDMTYKTGKTEKDGFKFVRTEDAKENPSYDKDGKETKGNFKPGVKQEITYVYEKTESEWTPLEETGKFQEHHIYITKDKDGKEIKREVVDGKVSGGTKDMTYTTGKAEKDGFKFVRTEDAKENPSYDKDGKETKGNFKPGVKQEITYVYEKTESEWTPLEETGKFQEHHIYITKDKDGKEIKREVVDGDVSGGTKDMTYTTGKAEKDGFKFVRTEDAKENPNYDKDGKETKGNFKPGVKQEITYVYEKTETPWTPLEPSEPVTPVEPEQPGTPEQPSKPVRQNKKLPKAGADYELLKLAAGALSIVSGFGLSLGRKKED